MGLALVKESHALTLGSALDSICGVHFADDDTEIPERRLVRKLLSDALVELDVQSLCGYVKRPHYQLELWSGAPATPLNRRKQQTYRWLMSDDNRHIPFSFLWVCSALDLSHDRIQRIRRYATERMIYNKLLR